MNNANSTRRPGGYAEILRVAYPLIISSASLTVMQFCDRLFLARFSADAIRAAVPAGIFSFTLFCGFFALVGYGGTFVAQYWGSNDRAGCGRATAQAVLMSLLCWPLVLALIPFGLWVLWLCDHGPAVYEAEKQYFSILMFGSLPALLNSAVNGYFSGRGETRTVMTANVTANLLNIVLDYAMIFGHWGFPRMGIAGAAWATVISGMVAPLYLFALYFGRRANALCATRSTFRFHGPLFRRLLRFGLPAGGHLMLDLTSFTLFVLLIGRIGELELAVSNVALSINLLAFMPVLGLGHAASIVVGQYQGRGDSASAARAGWRATVLGTVYMSTLGLTYVLFPSFYLALFAGTGEGALTLAELLPAGRVLLWMLAAWSVADACGIVLSGALKGAGDTRFVMWFFLFAGYGLFAVGEVVLVLWLKAGLLAAWGWSVVYVLVLGVGFVWRFASGRWKNIDLLGREAPPPLPVPGTRADAMVVE